MRRPIKQAALVLSAIVAMPFMVTTAVATPPTEFRTIPVSDFYPVTFPQEVSAPQTDTEVAAPEPTIIEVIRDPGPTRPPVLPPPAGAQPQQVAKAEVIATPKPTAKPKPAAPRVSVSSTGHRVTGVPTYYCRAGISICTHGYPDRAGVADFYAAAGPSLRVGKWRGRVVNVTANGKTIRVKLIDWCACGTHDHFLDLYYDAFKALGSPRKAVVTW